MSLGVTMRMNAILLHEIIAKKHFFQNLIDATLAPPGKLFYLLILSEFWLPF